MKSIRSNQSMCVIKSLLAIATIAGAAGSASAQSAQQAQETQVVQGTQGPGGLTDLDPRGVYFNRFTGGFPGTEWFTTIPIAGTNQYRLADIVGGGWNAIVTPEGAVDILNAPGDGQYSDEDNYILTPSFAGSTFIFNNNRVPHTDVDFPLQLFTPTDGNPLLSGFYTTQTQSVNPETSEVISSEVKDTIVTINGTTFQVADATGEFYTGIFETPTRVGFRVVVPRPNDTRFRTFAGSALNQSQNLLGSVRITSINTFEATFLLQSRTGLGNQSQAVVVMSGERFDPYPAGDLNGDRILDQDDVDLFLDQLGLVESDDAFNIAADLNGDYEIDQLDLDLFNALTCPGDFNMDTDLNFFDISSFLSAFTNSDPSADFNNDSDFNFFDVSAYLKAFAAGCP
jgi:hypothetical protein